MVRYGSGNRGGYNSGPTEMHDATCAECGKTCEVPFKPDGSRPVYCSDCYQKHKPARPARRYWIDRFLKRSFVFDISLEGIKEKQGRIMDPAGLFLLDVHSQCNCHPWWSCSCDLANAMHLGVMEWAITVESGNGYCRQFPIRIIRTCNPHWLFQYCGTSYTISSNY